MKKLFIFLFVLFLCNKINAIEHISLITTPITLYKDTTPISQGTGFLYTKTTQVQNVLFLVSNYHVFTGTSSKKREDFLGNIIEFQLRMSNNDPSKFKTIKYYLFTKNGNPIWIASNKYPNADVAAIPILVNTYQDCKLNSISTEWAKQRVKLKPSTPITLLGYPYSFCDRGNLLPIWKTGHIANELDYDFMGDPILLADVSAFPGMSGSPVFFVEDKSYQDLNGNIVFSPIQQFIGIYSAGEYRVENKYLQLFENAYKLGITNNENINIGYIWKFIVIDDMIDKFDVDKYTNDILKHMP